MQRNDWPTADPAALGIDADKLSELDPKIKSEYSNINGIVVVRNGYIAYERYYHGYGPNDTHHVASVTKSIMSAPLGLQYMQDTSKVSTKTFCTFSRILLINKYKPSPYATFSR